MPLGRFMHDEPGWSVTSNLAGEVPLSEHVAVILDRVSESREYFASRRPGASVVLRCAVHVAPNAPTPEMTLEASQVGELASLGADLDIDIYVEDHEQTH
jgi:hypothetical protein